MAQNTDTVRRLHALAKDDTLSPQRMRLIIEGIADSFYHASYGDLVAKEQDIAVLLATTERADIIHWEDRIVKIS